MPTPVPAIPLPPEKPPGRGGWSFPIVMLLALGVLMGAIYGFRSLLPDPRDSAVDPGRPTTFSSPLAMAGQFPQAYRKASTSEPTASDESEHAWFLATIANKTVRVNGQFQSLGTDTDGTPILHLQASSPTALTTVTAHFASSFRSRLSKLQPGQAIALVGQIDQATVRDQAGSVAITLDLRRCAIDTSGK